MGVLSCYSLEDLGPDIMQKAWKRLLTTFFFLAFCHWVREATASTKICPVVRSPGPG